MSERTNHLAAMSLEQLAEGTLPAEEAAQARSHLAACSRCTVELEGYKRLFSVLNDLPRFAPSPGFAQAVMARVHIAPKESLVALWLRRLIPSTRRGWILLGTALTAPATPFIALFAWLLIQPLVTPTMLGQWLVLRVQAAGQATTAWLLDRTVGGGALGLAEVAYTLLQPVPALAVGIALAILAVGIPVSAWALHRLIRIPVRRVTYAN